jgi:hypothetical protein
MHTGTEQSRSAAAKSFRDEGNGTPHFRIISPEGSHDVKSPFLTLRVRW